MEFASRSCLPDLLLEQVRAQPDNIAVAGDDVRLTFRELAGRSAAVAGCLGKHGVGPDDVVGVFAAPSPDLMAGVWGVLFAGSAYLPLSPDYPPERLRYVLADCHPKVIFTQPQWISRLAGLAPRGTTILTMADAAEPAGPHAGLRPGHLAYLIYTSGSTGHPKGVMIEHRAIVSQLRWLRAAHDLDSQVTIIHKTPISFDAAQWELLAPACGSRVVLGAGGIYRDPNRLIDTITAHDVSLLQCVPTLLRALLDTDRLPECKSLAQLFSGGEVLSAQLARDCLAALPECQLVNLYGPTECTINASSFVVDERALGDGSGPEAGDAVSIGKPVSDTRFHILDGERSPVEGGGIGELYIGGVQLARGYLGDRDLTAAKFIDDPFQPGGRLYRTGDLARWNPGGTVQFVGRADNQVKIRGYRVELDEIKLAIETHDWVRKAAVIFKDDVDKARQRLVAFVELDPREAALMDQGTHSTHHLSKFSRLQAKAQLSNAGCRDEASLRGRLAIDLPGASAAPRQRRLAFARKTYRFFDGGAVTGEDIVGMLSAGATASRYRGRGKLSLPALGEILRYFGQYHSAERLLPKYCYASPGALYATQLYLEIGDLAGLRPGYYYYHPVRHQLIFIRAGSCGSGASLKLHFVGKKSAIEPVYKDNIREVLEIEAGHMVGLLDEILPEYGLDIRETGLDPDVLRRLEVAGEDYYLGTFKIVSADQGACGRRGLYDRVSIYVQAHQGNIEDLPDGQYEYRDGKLAGIGPEVVLRKHVIAINQQVYSRSSFGVSVLGDPARGWLGYADLGRVLQHLQANDRHLGLMSSGYSSMTGHDLASATRIDEILRACGRETGPSYFFIGARVADEQIRSEGMREDVVHMSGPMELIRDDLAARLPDYMMPAQVVVLDKLPLTPNGKIDSQALQSVDLAGPGADGRPPVLPRTEAEARIAVIWRRELKMAEPSVLDDFFVSGGNSLIAVRLITSINAELGCSLPLQILFECPTIEQLALVIDDEEAGAPSRLVNLAPAGSREPVFCWPGLGGFAMNLKPLAGHLDLDRPFYGVQTCGINEGEVPYPTIAQMAAADLELIRKVQPEGPYVLWGYSFGARVAFEAAQQLERAGARVAELVLIAPGMPRVRANPGNPGNPVGNPVRLGGVGKFADQAYLTILFSVFSGSITDPLLCECLSTVTDEDSFITFVSTRLAGFDADQVRRIVRVVDRTYGLIVPSAELNAKIIEAPVTVFTADGDEKSFIDAYRPGPREVIKLGADHYSVLRSQGIGELVSGIHRLLCPSAS